MYNLIQGDCLEKMKDIPDKSIDFILTDPPYNSTNCAWDILIPFEPMWKELNRVIKPNGAIALFGSEPFSSKLRCSNLEMFKYDWIWNKNQPSGIATAKYMPMKNHEIISIFCEKGTIYYPQKVKSKIKDRTLGKSNGKFWNKTNIGITGMKPKKINNPDNILNSFVSPRTVLDFNIEPNSKGKLHPTQKPTQLLEYLIKTYTLEGETVLDFTMGSGSTGVACLNTNRNFIGIEKDEHYFEVAKNRIEETEKELQNRLL